MPALQVVLPATPQQILSKSTSDLWESICHLGPSPKVKIGFFSSSRDGFALMEYISSKILLSAGMSQEESGESHCPLQRSSLWSGTGISPSGRGQLPFGVLGGTEAQVICFSRSPGPPSSPSIQQAFVLGSLSQSYCLMRSHQPSRPSSSSGSPFSGCAYPC